MIGDIIVIIIIVNIIIVVIWDRVYLFLIVLELTR